MTKGAKIGIGVGIAVALAIGSYFLFFRKKADKNGNNKKSSSDDSNIAMETVFKSPVTYLQKVKDKPNNAWFHFNNEDRPAKGTVIKGDSVIIASTDKFDGEYPVDGVWIDKNGKVGAVSINLQGKYEVVYPQGKNEDRTFEGYGVMLFKRPVSSFCGCGA